jgi:hypothetical protein
MLDIYAMLGIGERHSRERLCGQEAFDTVITRSTDALLKRKNNLIRRFYLWGEDKRRSIE